MGAYTFAGIVAPFGTQAGQMQACLHKSPAFAVGYLTSLCLQSWNCRTQASRCIAHLCAPAPAVRRLRQSG